MYIEKGTTISDRRFVHLSVGRAYDGFLLIGEINTSSRLEKVI